MKIRQGHVSNSSSSSFCIYGVHFESYGDGPFTRENLTNKLLENKEVINALMKYKGEYQSKKDYLEQVQKSPDAFDLFELIKKIGDNFESHSRGCDDKSCYVGKSFTLIKDDETGKQFKESIKQTIVNLIGEEPSCNVYEEAWMDY